MKFIEHNIEKYLDNTYYINWRNENIIRIAKYLAIPQNEIGTVNRTFCFVRDEIKHSWDIQDKRVTIRATDVLKEKVGICWAKANLLCALLRANSIPVGICYQRLTLGDTLDTGYCIHALNAVYLASLDKWIRLDARGNKEGIYAEPLSITMSVLENSKDALYMYLHSLPQTYKPVLGCDNVNLINKIYKGGVIQWSFMCLERGIIQK